MTIFFACLLTIGFGFFLPICIAVWSEPLCEKHKWFKIIPLLVVIACVNAPAYSCAIFGLVPWSVAAWLQLFAILFIVFNSLVTGENLTESYVATMIIMVLVVLLYFPIQAKRERDKAEAALPANTSSVPPATNDLSTGRRFAQ